MIQQALKLVGKKKLEWVTTRIPTLEADQVLIETIATAISIGAEIPQFEATDLTDASPIYPRKVGYESYGRVVDKGENVTTLHVGDRVIAFYGQQTYGIVSEQKAFYVPPEVDYETALLAILSCDAAKGVRKLAPSSTDSVIVSGLGTIGLLAIYYLRTYYGVTMIDAIEPDSNRKELAHTFGAGCVYTPNEVKESFYDYGIECSARNDGFMNLQEAVKPNGSICILSDGNREELVLQPQFYEKELHIVGSSDGWDYTEHFSWYFEASRRTPYIKEIFELDIEQDSLIGTFQELSEGVINPIKVSVTYKNENTSFDE
ncbi:MULTISPECIES: alcohol dehydrogenase [unclassified Exiguobacterium]|uniref:alcohol dehydrogenase catalytic domain-containing protein n=1 Tax=unclassified Exiguobacterium TaxID=2644629 RepID=UPI001BE9FFE2|nr:MULTISPECIES: alcohol dehydrogenase [unclassified Exiguobacterium]